MGGLAARETLERSGAGPPAQPFAIGPRTSRGDGATPRDTSATLFSMAWGRYLPQRERLGAPDPTLYPQHPPQAAVYADGARSFEPQTTNRCGVVRNRGNIKKP